MLPLSLTFHLTSLLATLGTTILGYRTRARDPDAVQVSSCERISPSVCIDCTVVTITLMIYPPPHLA
jgi:hypothetical protein